MGYLGRLDESLETYLEAERIAHDQKDLALLADAQYGLGWVHFLRGELDPAPHYLQHAAANFRAVGMERRASLVEGFSGDVHRARGDLDLAEAAYVKSMAYRERSGRMASEPFLNMAMVELARENPVEAAQWARQAVDFEGRNGRRVVWATHLATELAVAAHTNDVAHWDESWTRLQNRLEESNEFAHYDLTFALDRAAREAHKTLDADRASAAVELAKEMWLRLDRAEEAAALDQNSG
jgi:tetratricopeptide (TPR) repeat protein